MKRDPLPVSRALVSVWDKTGLVPFCRRLADLGVEIVSSGGTEKTLKDAGIPVIAVSHVTGSPEILDGRVKTLHPRIHGGILARKDSSEHLKQLEEHGIMPFDLVVVNLYPFRQTIEKPGSALDQALEMIDIGGPAMVRAAAKNFPSVAVIVDPRRYQAVLDEISEEVGISFATRLLLAREAFAHTCLYDSGIAAYLEDLDGEGERTENLFPDTLLLAGTKFQDLRYGENPHQKAAFYARRESSGPGLSRARQLWGKDLSYNNILDTDAAIGLVMEFAETACVIIKHTNPCGASLGKSPAEAYLKAIQADPLSAFGGIVAFNREVDEEAAREIVKIFTEVLIAPAFSESSLEILREKKNLRILQISGLGDPDSGREAFSVRTAAGGYLVQVPDQATMDEKTLKTVTRRNPTEEEMAALRFAWVIAKHVKSNAIVYAGEGQLVATGAGQMSRVDSVRFGAMKASLPTEGTVMASDAFFPFRDGIDEAAKAGVTAVIQPGGSLRDDEVVKAADEHGMAMVFTGIRHFRH
ncbi:MAG: bifunctional phosphoribosylaminoimidazolecarboxamide formyltransferase/IMP cyclohydrolase [Proteobacteria bacterium]|nr:bifunctional phosphoribosylaminoimidazolecarboxamide formyltransferase/IMP cyclohydrolase [Pseudomonadota bacterium]